MKKKRFLVISIILYVLAALSFAYMVWAIIQCHEYISSLISSGSLITSGNTYQIVNYYMASCAPYGVYAITFAVFGFLLYTFGKPAVKENAISEVYTQEDNDIADDTTEE